jgi:hypothetical protein
VYGGNTNVQKKGKEERRKRERKGRKTMELY